MLLSELIIKLMEQATTLNRPVIFEHRDLNDNSDVNYSIDDVEFQNGFLVLISKEGL